MKRVLALSRNPNTIFWLLELIYLLSKKYSPKVLRPSRKRLPP